MDKKAIVIAIGGSARNGKDTSSVFIKKCLEDYGKKVLILHYADYLKFICIQYFGWNGEKDESGRTLLQQVGTEKIRSKDPDFWVNIIEELMNVLQDDFDYFIIPDVRFPNEIEFLKEFNWQVKSLKVSRPGFDNGLTEEQKNHKSETALNDYAFDFLIEAKDIKELNENCKEVVDIINSI